MQRAFRKTTVLALLAGAGCVPAASAADALASAGGVPYGGEGGAPVRPAHRSAAHKATLATWFGPGFYGRRTACGQMLTPAVVGVAHRTLPCGTLVNVSYRGRRLILPVIDRGPYAGNGADWDLTTGAARALGMQDTARIAARVVGSIPNTSTLGLPPGAAPAMGVPPPPGAASPTGGASAA